MSVTATKIRLSGQLSGEKFLDWICHRADLLDLNGWVQSDSAQHITIVVAGPQPMIDAMETACSLGPIEVDVARITSARLELSAQPQGFVRLS